MERESPHFISSISSRLILSVALLFSPALSSSLSKTSLPSLELKLIPIGDEMNKDCQVSLVPEWQWAVMTILQEARSQTLDGMIGVAEVIRDRTRSKFYSNGTVISTVLWPYQFSGWNTKDPNREICGKMEMDNPLVIMAIKAWKLALNNNTNLTGGALFYHAISMNPFPTWSSSPEMEKTTQIQDHIFYRKVNPNVPNSII